MSSDDPIPSRLVLQDPDGDVRVFVLEPGRSTTLGRDAGNTIVLESRFVSKRHALLSWTPRGVRIEDQDSANGLLVNGLTVHAAQLSPGDLIQIGDLRLVYEVEDQTMPAAPPIAMVAPGPALTSAGPRAGIRGLTLAVVALCSLVIVGGLAGAYLTLLRPAEPSPHAGGASRTDPFRPADTPMTPFDSPQARAIEQQALAAGARPVDRLFDEGARAYREGRLLDAYRLLHGVLQRDQSHDRARRTLLRVRVDRDLRLRSLQAAASRADEALEFDDAARQWEAVQALTLEAEPLHARATAEVTRLRQRAAQ